MRAQKIYNAFVLCVDPNHINYILVTKYVLDCGISCANAESECQELRGSQRCLDDLQGPPERNKISSLFKFHLLIVNLQFIVFR